MLSRHLLLTLLMLFGILGFTNEVEARAITDKHHADDEQVEQDHRWLNNVAEEPQNPFGITFLSTHPSHRLASSRPIRLSPTSGGKPTQHGGRWSQSNSTNPLSHSSQQHVHLGYGLPTSSPRKYYVIALRRLLC